MKIKIYQVNLDRDEHTAAFRGLYDKPMTEAGARSLTAVFTTVFLRAKSTARAWKMCSECLISTTPKGIGQGRFRSPMW